MAERLSRPGTTDGPCIEECQHMLCRLTKRRADGRCLHCGDVIGYGRRFYQILGGPSDEKETVSHALCLEVVAAADAEGQGVAVRARLQRLREAAEGF